jgi:hypothetical protein
MALPRDVRSTLFMPRRARLKLSEYLALSRQVIDSIHGLVVAMRALDERVRDLELRRSMPRSEVLPEDENRFITLGGRGA